MGDAMEQTLQKINQHTIALSSEDIKRNNEIIHPLLDVLINQMKSRDELFSKLHQRIFYGGSYYDGVRIKKPDEFDLDLLLRFPKCEVLRGKVPGHVRIKLDSKSVDSETMQIRDLFADDRGYLLTSMFNAWFKSVVHKALSPFKQSSGDKEYKIAINGYKLKISVHDHGPAKDLLIRVRDFKINIDLVPCILFPGEDWPAFITKNPVKSQVDTFFTVPMSPKTQLKSIRRYHGQPSHTYNYRRCIHRIRNAKNKGKHTFYRYWRLSFQEEERYILQDKQFLKPCLKFLKLLRDSLHQHQIASYYLKNFMLNLDEENDASFWNRSLNEVFMDVLKEYVKMLKSGLLEYYWDKQYNILENVSREQLDSITGSTERVFNKLKHTKDPMDILDCFKLR